MTRFLKILAVLNSAGALASLALLVMTWSARQIVTDRARGYALEKTRQYVEPAIQKVESVYAKPLVRRALPASARSTLDRELGQYHESPERWLEKLAAGGKSRAEEFRFPEVKNPLVRKILDPLADRLSKAGEHFERSFANLILNLRIVLGTNFCALVIAAALCFSAKDLHLQRVAAGWSVALLLTTIFCTVQQVGDTTGLLWSILTNRYPGWSYPGTHLCITFYVFFRIHALLLKRPGGGDSSPSHPEPTRSRP